MFDAIPTVFESEKESQSPANTALRAQNNASQVGTSATPGFSLTREVWVFIHIIDDDCGHLKVTLTS
jgi:hypothetical protein